MEAMRNCLTLDLGNVVYVDCEKWSNSGSPDDESEAADSVY